MDLKTREKLFEALKKANPSPGIELDFNSNFELLVAVMLSAQATDVSVNKATQKLFPVAHTPSDFLKLGEKKLKEFIKTIGLFNTKAKNIIKTCEILVQQYDSDVPSSREALESLPGVGRKTANVVLNTAFGVATVAVDTHIFRVSNRTGLAPGKTPYEVEMKLMKAIPKRYLQNANRWLVLHGRYVCLARKPKCSECVIREYCEYKMLRCSQTYDLT